MATTAAAPIDKEVAEGLSEHSQKIVQARLWMAKREKSRLDHNFILADEFRTKLNEMGVEVLDQKDGPSGWKFKDGSSKKLPAGSAIPSELLELTRKRPTEENAAGEEKDKKKRKKGTSSASSNVGGEASTGAGASKVAKTKELSQDQIRTKAVLTSVLTPASSTSSSSSSSSSSSASIKKVEGVVIEDVVLGSGRVAKAGDRLKMNYVGRLKANNRLFDASKKPFPFRLGRGEVCFFYLLVAFVCFC